MCWDSDLNWAGLADLFQEVEARRAGLESGDRILQEDWPLGGCSSFVVAKPWSACAGLGYRSRIPRDTIRSKTVVSSNSNKE